MPSKTSQCKKALICLFAALALSNGAAAQNSCPDLSPFYAGEGFVDWVQLEAGLAAIKLDCLQSSEFFALHGAAQLNSGRVDESLESLERALLLDPSNGAAQIDYGQALFQQGQVFMALEVNERLIERIDLPKELLPPLVERQKVWKSMTRQKSFQLDALGGYDNNLNGAPSPDQIVLTLSGEAIPLALDSDFRPVNGPYLNLRGSGRFRSLAPNHQNNWATELRARTSEDSGSNIIQFTGRYSYVKPGNDNSWQVNSGVSHLNFGGSGLFSGFDTSIRYQTNSNLKCKPFYDFAMQYQYYHQQDFLNGLESKVSAGLNCPLGESFSNQRFSVEAGLLNNQALRSARLGGDRQGWQIRADWQMPIGSGFLRAQANHIELDDRQGYSALIDNGAERELERSFLLIQYRRPLGILGPNSSLLLNLYRQNQSSNIEFFRTDNTSAEIGLSWSF
ncbi:MAG: tetratricopeptide repeat protein [Pseudohongiellaceae bacterium]